jgi:TonB family protein
LPLRTAENSTDTTRTRRAGDTENQVAVQKENKTITPTANAQTETPKNNSPLAVGSLVGYATEKSNPVYPPMARNMRMTGVVKVDLVIGEDGKVAEVQNTSGPPMLQRAALDAVRNGNSNLSSATGRQRKPPDLSVSISVYKGLVN